MRDARFTTAAMAGLLGLLGLLAIPGPEPEVAEAPARGHPFTWDHDAYWRSLEARYANARALGAEADTARAAAYRWYALPAARLAKAYSWLVQLFGRAGPVPEGMSAAAALRIRSFSERQRRLAESVAADADRLTAERGYPPPYWVLLELARANDSRR